MSTCYSIMFYLMLCVQEPQAATTKTKSSQLVINVVYSMSLKLVRPPRLAADQAVRRRVKTKTTRTTTKARLIRPDNDDNIFNDDDTK